MSNLLDEIESKGAQLLTDLREIASRHEATVDHAAADAEAALQSPLAAAAAAAVHVPDAVLGKFAEIIQVAEAEFAKFAEAAPAPAADVLEPAADGEPVPAGAAAGPAVGGQAS